MNGQLRLLLLLAEGRVIYRPGETVRGTLQLDALQAFEPTAVNLTLAWETWGEGDHDEAIVAKGSFPGKRLEPGQHTLWFELKVPNGPLSYFGTNLTIGWTVRAHVDLPWARDVHARLPIQVDGWQEPATAEAAETTRARYVPGVVAEAKRSWRMPRLLRDAGRALASAGTVVMGGLALHSDFGVGTKVGIVAAGVIALLWQVPRLATYLVFGNATLRVEPAEVPQGHTVHAAITAKAGAAQTLERATVSVVVEEVTTTRHGSREHATRYHEVLVTNLQLGKANPLAGGRIQMVASFQLPPFAYPSFEAPNNLLTYSISVSARHGVLARFKDSRRFAVVPSIPL